MLLLLEGSAIGQETYSWHNVRVGGGGFSPAIVFSRAAHDLAYVRTDIGGIYRWDHASQSWMPLQDDFTNGNYLGIESIALDRHDPEVVFAAVGMYHTSPAAIIRSTNRGQSWSVYPVDFRMGGNEPGRGVGERLSIDPNDADILYFGSRYDGLQRSVDRGRTWAKVTSFPYPGLGLPKAGATHTGLSFVVFDPSSGIRGRPSRTLFVGVADPGERHLFRSDDAGRTWRSVPGEPRPDFLPVQAQTNERGSLYITYSNGAGPNGATDGAVYELRTATNRWVNITPDRSSPTAYMGLSVAGGQVVVATLNRWGTGDILWRSTDGGRIWQDVRELSTRDVSATPFLTWGDEQAPFGWWIAGVAIDPFDSGHVAYTTGATLYATDQLQLTDSKRTVRWQPWVQGMEETAVITLISPTQGPQLYSGFGDIGGYAHEDLHVSPPMFNHPAFNNTDHIDYAEDAAHIVVRSGVSRRANGNEPALAWSGDYGRTWQPIALPASQRRLRIVTSADGNTFIVMTPIPKLSRDHGTSWNSLDLPPFAQVIGDRADPRRFYAVDFENGRLLSSDDAGATFKLLPSAGLPHNLSADAPGNPEMPVPLLAVPGRAGDLWLISQAHLFHSLDAGHSFQAVPNDLSIAHLSFGKAAPGRDYPALYAIASRGELFAIWRSDDRGFTWNRINDARHEYGRRFRCIAADMRIDGRVYVGTDGRGIIYSDKNN